MRVFSFVLLRFHLHSSLRNLTTQRSYGNVRSFLRFLLSLTVPYGQTSKRNVRSFSWRAILMIYIHDTILP